MARIVRMREKKKKLAFPVRYGQSEEPDVPVVFVVIMYGSL